MTTDTITQASPGPWEADGAEVIAADGYRILEGGVHRHKSHDADKGHWSYEDGSARDIGEGEEEANAILAAAAPDMLAALKLADAALEIGGFQDIQPVRATIRAAISKAEGR